MVIIKRFLYILLLFGICFWSCEPIRKVDVLLAINEKYQKNDIKISSNNKNMRVSGMAIPGQFKDRIWLTFEFKSFDDSSFLVNPSIFGISSNKYAVKEMKKRTGISNGYNIFLVCEHRNYLDFDSKELHEELDSRYLVIKIKEIFSKPIIVNIKLDNENIIKRFTEK